MFRLIDKSISSIDGRGPELILKKLREDAARTQTEYLTGVSPYIVSRYNSESAESNTRAAYFEFIGERGTVGTIDRCIDALITLVRIRISDIPDGAGLENTLKKSANQCSNIGVEYVLSGDCECGGEFVMYASSNERKCATCGMSASVADEFLEDQNMYMKEIQKTKQNRHHPLHHCKIWVGRIQAWLGAEVPDEVYEQLKVCLRRDSINLRNISCNRIRKYLKEKKLTAWNNFVPFIRKVICKIEPPQLTTVELEQLYETFARVAKILQDMRPDNNINYYPVFIFKILDEQLPLGPRKVQIMECIHLQSEDTIKEIDNLYAQICERMGRTTKPRPINWGEYKKFL